MPDYQHQPHHLYYYLCFILKDRPSNVLQSYFMSWNGFFVCLFIFRNFISESETKLISRLRCCLRNLTSLKYIVNYTYLCMSVSQYDCICEFLEVFILSCSKMFAFYFTHKRCIEYMLKILSMRTRFVGLIFIVVVAAGQNLILFGMLKQHLIDNCN